MTIEEQQELIELTQKLLKVACLTAEKPFFITNFISPIVRHSGIISKFDLMRDADLSKGAEPRG